MSESPTERKRARVRWPLNTGEDIELCTGSAVTTVPGGYVVELARFLLTGLIERESEEVLDLLKDAQVNVLGRYFLSLETLRSLRDNINARLRADGREKTEGDGEHGESEESQRPE